METLIIYATKHGSAEKCAALLADGLAPEVTVLNIKAKASRNPEFKRFQNVIIGGSIHAGLLQKSVKEFMKNHSSVLKQKKLGLFLCHMEEGDKAHKQFEENFPEDLRSHAVAEGLFGGAFDFERMNFLEKAIVKKVSGVEKSVFRIDKEAVRAFITRFSGSFNNPEV